MANKVSSESNDNSPFKYQFEILKMEIENIQTTIGRIDNITHQIKNWTAVIWAGSISLIISNPNFQYINIFWLTSIIPLIFWITDGHFRRRQRAFIFRSEKISEFINSESFITSCNQNKIIDFIIYDPRGIQYRNSLELNKFSNMWTMWRSKSMRYFYLSLIIVSILLQLILLLTQSKQS